VSAFAIQLTQPAIRDIRSFPETAHSKVVEGIMSLRQDPFPSPPLKKKLKGFGFALYRLRVADHRILYRIDEKTVTVMRVIDRKDLDKAVKRLKR
jgi:mRNA-degrading endonuclease RelE of RelBE toxin-antitoxin system